MIPGTVRHLAKQVPNLVMQIKPGTSESLFDDLSERSIEAALIALPPFELPSRYRIEVVREEPLVLLLSPKGSGKSSREKLERNPYSSFD